MPTIAAGTQQTITLPANSKLSIGGGLCFVTVGNPSGSARPTIEEPYEFEGGTVGPFPTSVSVLIRATQAVAYSITPAIYAPALADVYADQSGNLFAGGSPVSGDGVQVVVLQPGQAAAAANWALIDAALAAASTAGLAAKAMQAVAIWGPGVFWVAGQIKVGSWTNLIVGDGVILRRYWTGVTENGTFLRNRNQPASNADTTTGDVNVKVTCYGEFDCNCYDPTAVFGPTYYWDGMQWISVDGLTLDPIRITNPVKTHGRLAKVNNARIFNFTVEYDTAGVYVPNNGKDFLFIAGNCRNIHVKGVRGRSNDDGITCNTADVPTWSMPFAVGHISDILVEDVDIDTRAPGPGGATLALYPECWLDETSGLGAGNVDPFLGNKPAITGITQTAGVATVTTNIPHQLNVGSYIQISGATPTGYNTTSFTDTNGWAVVHAVPRATTFEYFVVNTTGAYVSGASLLISWDLKNVSYRNVRGVVGTKLNTFRNRGGVARSVRYERVQCTSSANAAESMISMSGTTAVNTTIVDSAPGPSEWVGLFGMINGAYLAGVTRIIGGGTPSAFRAHSPSGLCYIDVLLSAEHVVVEGYHFRQGVESGDTTKSVIRIGAGVRMLTVRDCRYYSPRSTGGRFIRAEGGDTSDQIITVDGCVIGGDGATGDGGVLLIQPATTGSGKLIINLQNTHFTGAFNSAIGTINGLNLQVNVDRVTLNSLTNGLLYFGNANSNVELNVGAINYNGQALMAASQPAWTGGGLTVRGLNARLDITKALRADGAVLYNTNASANNGTDGAIPVGLYFCTGTASGSWKLAGTTGGANKQY